MGDRDGGWGHTGDLVDTRGTTLPSIRCWSLVGHWLNSYADDTNISPSEQNVVHSVGPAHGTDWLTVSESMGYWSKTMSEGHWDFLCVVGLLGPLGVWDFKITRIFWNHFDASSGQQDQTLGLQNWWNLWAVWTGGTIGSFGLLGLLGNEITCHSGPELVPAEPFGQVWFLD